MNAAREDPDRLHLASQRQVRSMLSVLDHAHEAFIAIDTGGFVVDWNPHAQRTFGWTSEEAIGQMLADLIIPPRYRAAHAKGLRSCVAGRPAGLLDRRLELSALDRSGREFPVEVTITQDGTLTPVRFYAFLHDISERRLSESLLHAQLVITRVFAEARSTNEAMRGLLAGLGEAMEWQSGAWWSREEGGEIL